jgi:hypothetical protein
MNNKTDIVIKVGLSILFLFCLADMPYGFFQIVRFIAFIGFAILAYRANEQVKQTELIIYGALAMLFQPFFKISLGRTIWNVVDVIVAIGLLLSIFNPTKKNQKE